MGACATAWAAVTPESAAASSAGGLRTHLTLHSVAEQRRAPLERLIRHALQDVERVLHARIEGDLRVDIAGSDRAFADVVRAHGGQAHAEPWIAGLAMLHDDRIVIRLDGQGLLRTGEVVRHEIAHIAMHALAGQRPLPRWYHEGVAMLVAGEATFDRLRESIGAGAFGQLDSLDNLEDGFAGNRVAAERAYATSAGFLRFAVGRTANPAALADIHRRMAYGLHFEPAFIATFGLKPDALFELYAHYVGTAGSRWTVMLSDSVLWSLLGVLSFIALLVGWMRRPRLSDDPMDLRAIAEAGEEAMRTGVLWRGGLPRRLRSARRWPQPEVGPEDPPAEPPAPEDPDRTPEGTPSPPKPTGDGG